MTTIWELAIDTNIYCDGVILSYANQRSTLGADKVKDLPQNSASDFARCFTSFNMTRYILDNIYIVPLIYIHFYDQ